ncbi:hypothetical protein BCV69DRAFT_284310 [Microstroma glucosiphilum]|uniref:Uncharacterized protein n=1 Tax=Pseudomicrostroma glucosiphilum TaxID=1684307 RepID=A0A316U187_9BASI|nr:hypothetical protein BCV69DRAFT_284310 [Pseudomicrostroma glucosiphilum]PWN19152.1 hypothetical protein BCV69DRAFT_284310 [Pseudomicrostroma glucosiphilum]
MRDHCNCSLRSSEVGPLALHYLRVSLCTAPYRGRARHGARRRRAAEVERDHLHLSALPDSLVSAARERETAFMRLPQKSAAERVAVHLGFPKAASPLIPAYCRKGGQRHRGRGSGTIDATVQECVETVLFATSVLATDRVPMRLPGAPLPCPIIRLGCLQRAGGAGA